MYSRSLSISQDWEEIADAGLGALLRSISRKSGYLDQPKSTTMHKMTSIKDLTRLKKRLVHVIERLDSCRESDIAENEQSETGNHAST